MKTVCFVSFAAYPLFNPSVQANFGGSETQLYQLANKLAKNPKYKIYFIVGDYHQPDKEILGDITLIKAFRFPTTHLKYLLGIYLQLIFLLTLFRTKADIFIQRAAGIETGLIAFYCQLFHKKFIYMTASSIDADKSYSKMFPLNGLLFEYGLKNANLVICQNLDQQKLLRKNYNIGAPIIRNSFNLPHKKANTRKNCILWVGSSQQLKQPHIFLDLAISLPQYRFIMIMPKNNPALWQHIYHQSQKIPNLKFIEKIQFEKISKYYSQAKVFVNTSTFEGFPNTFVQAAMSGVPLISLNVNPDNFLTKYHCGYCAAGNVQKLTQHVQTLLTNQKLWLQTSQNAYNYARKNHDIKKNVKKLIKIISSLDA